MANDPFPDPDITVAATNVPTFDIEKTWALVDALRLPTNFGAIPNHTTYAPIGLPARKHGEGTTVNTPRLTAEAEK